MPQSWKQHYEEAERLLGVCADDDLDAMNIGLILQMADVHATLATAKAEPVPHRVPVRA